MQVNKSARGSISARSAHRSARRLPRRLNGFEHLESRTVLSANFASSLHNALASQSSFDLDIRGTDVAYSELGLPAAMGGDVFLAGGNSASTASIGRYEESLSPIFMDVNADLIPDFVGTTGIATFNFFVGSEVYGSIGTITTANTSYIQAMTPTGEMVVGSQGTIVDSTRLLGRLSGSFVSQSTVSMGAGFSMQTHVSFTVDRPVRPLFGMLAVAAEFHARNDDTELPGDLEDDALPAKKGRHADCDHSKHSRDRDDHGKHHHGLKHHKAYDKAFAGEADWRHGNLVEKLTRDLLG